MTDGPPLHLIYMAFVSPSAGFLQHKQMSLSQNIVRFKGGTAARGWRFLSQTWNWNMDVAEVEADDRWWVLMKEKSIHQHQLPRQGGRLIVSVWSGNKPHTVKHPLQIPYMYLSDNYPLTLPPQRPPYHFTACQLKNDSCIDKEFEGEGIHNLSFRSVAAPSRRKKKRLQHADVCPRNW